MKIYIPNYSWGTMWPYANTIQKQGVNHTCSSISEWYVGTVRSNDADFPVETRCLEHVPLFPHPCDMIYPSSRSPNTNIPERTKQRLILQGQTVDKLSISIRVNSLCLAPPPYSLCLSVSLSLSVSPSLSYVCLSVCLFVCLSVFLSLSLFRSLSRSLSPPPLSLSLSPSLSLSLSLYLSISLSLLVALTSLH